MRASCRGNGAKVVNDVVTKLEEMLQPSWRESGSQMGGDATDLLSEYVLAKLVEMS